MAGPALLNAPYVNRPKASNFALKFMTVGDGMRGPDGGLAPEVQRSSRSVPFSKISSIAHNPSLDLLVIATQEAGKPFMLGDRRGNTWTAPTNVNGYDNYVERLFFVEEFNVFIGLSGPSKKQNDYFALSGSADGKIWNKKLFGSGSIRSTGFAYSGPLNRALVASSSAQANMVLTDGITFQPFTIPGGGFSVLWSTRNNQFMAMRPSGQGIKVSSDGSTWGDHPYAIPSVCGNIAGSYAAYSIQMPAGERLLIFTVGGTAPAWYSDDNGLNWNACQGMENTGSVTRYVAVDGNAVYVAFNAELNKGMVSLDYGQTWERSDHLSGNASGVIAL